MTSGVIGCPAQEIRISDEKNVVWGGQGVNWRAECRGHRFVCSYSGSAACKEDLQPAAGAARPPAEASAAPAATPASAARP